MFSFAGIRTCASFAASWLIADAWLPEHDGLSLLWRSVVVGSTAGAATGIVAGAGIIAVAGAVSGLGAKNTITETLSFTIIVIPVVGGLWFNTVIIRVLSTLRHLQTGFCCLPNNWRENMFSLDPWHPPSLLPGDETFSGSTILNDFSREDIIRKVFAILLAPFIYIPALLYRWSIKSTFWFYWPILYIRSGRLEHPKEKDAFNQKILSLPLEKFRRSLSCLTLLIFIYIAISGNTMVDIHSTNPAMLFPYLLAIDVFAIKPWQWFQLATVVLTFLLWNKAHSISIELGSAEKYGQKYDWKRIDFMYRLFRLRNLCTYFILAIGFVFTALYFEDTYNYLPNSWVAWLSEFFEMELPIRYNEN